MKRRPWTLEELDFLIENYSAFSNRELAEKLNRPYRSITQKALEFELRKNPMYTVYKGDEFLDVGSRDELIDKLGITKNRFYTISSPSFHKTLKEGSKALVAYRLEDMA